MEEWNGMEMGMELEREEEDEEEIKYLPQSIRDKQRSRSTTNQTFANIDE